MFNLGRLAMCWNQLILWLSNLCRDGNDDFGRALGYRATDTFRLTIANEQVLAASFAGDDPPIFAEMFGWIQRQSLTSYRAHVILLQWTDAQRLRGGRRPCG